MAASIIDGAAGSLFQAALAVIRKLRMEAESFPVAVAGGVFRHGRALRATFEELLREHFPKARVVEPRLSAERGALLVARAALQGKSLFSGAPAEGETVTRPGSEAPPADES